LNEFYSRMLAFLKIQGGRGIGLRTQGHIPEVAEFVRLCD
jgi:hypothetical protein